MLEIRCCVRFASLDLGLIHVFKAYRFFEQRRLLENKPKSARRTANEALCGVHGFALEHDTGMRWMLGGRP